MIPPVAPLARLAEVNDRLFVNVLEGVTDEQARSRPTSNTNSMSFVSIHIVDARYYLARMLGSENPNPFADLLKDIRSVEQLVDPPPLSDIKRAWEAVAAALATRLDGLTQESANEPAPSSFPILDGSILGAVTFLMQHESYHIGQLALLRKYWGLPAMTYD